MGQLKIAILAIALLAAPLAAQTRAQLERQLDTLQSQIERNYDPARAAALNAQWDTVEDKLEAMDADRALGFTLSAGRGSLLLQDNEGPLVQWVDEQCAKKRGKPVWCGK
jgi:glycerol-3-phosphate O-acyltransferase